MHIPSRKELTQKVICLLLKAVGSLGDRARYALSDLSFPLVYHVVRYRRRVVRENLRNSFPHKNLKELRQIERAYYHYLCDYALEDCLLWRMTPEEMRQRLTYIGMERCLKMIDQRGGIILLMAHYANYEWVSGIPASMTPDVLGIQVYKPMRNGTANEVVCQMREQFGCVSVPMQTAGINVYKRKFRGEKMVVGLIADQWPRRHHRHYALFLNRETPFFTGAEKMAKMTDFPVFYLEMRRLKRGYCTAELKLLCEHPKEAPEGNITRQYAQMLEQTICREPQYWLWSHRRWKDSPPPIIPPNA